MDRIHPIAGVISSVGFLVLWIAAATQDPSWHLGEFSLSDLGNCGIDSAELCFNLACGLSGAMGLVLSLGIIRIDDRFRYCGYITTVSSLALIGIGIVDLGYHRAHLIFAGIYFLSAVSSIILSIYCDHKDGRKRFAIFDAALFMIMLASVLTQVFEVYEPIVVCCILTWTLTHSVRLFISCDGITS